MHAHCPSIHGIELQKKRHLNLFPSKYWAAIHILPLPVRGFNWINSVWLPRKGSVPIQANPSNEMLQRDRYIIRKKVVICLSVPVHTQHELHFKYQETMHTFGECTHLILITEITGHCCYPIYLSKSHRAPCIWTKHSLVPKCLE